MSPLVSVIVPAYNCEKYIGDSVRSALDQTLINLEVIAIDDASSDGTPDVLSSLADQDDRIRIFRNGERLDAANTRNRGFELARGRYIALLDGDDLWLPDKLEKQLALMEQSNCDFCYTAYTFINENGQIFGKPYLVPAQVSLKRLVRENVIGCSTTLCKEELLKKHPMRPDYAHEDYVLWLELLQSGYKACGVTESLVLYRVQQESRSGNKKRAAKSRWHVYRDFLKMSLPQASLAFLSYAAHGILKYYGR